MNRYPAYLDGEAGAYGVTFPDLDGIASMGETIDEAMINAEEALRDYALEAEKDGIALAPPSRPEAVAPPAGATMILVPLIRQSGKTVRANLTLDEDVLAYIDSEAKRRKLTRTAYINWMTRRIAQMGA